MTPKVQIAMLAAIAAGIALADIDNQTVTLQTGSILNLDNGTIGSAGDVLFNGTSLTFQGNATGYVLGALGANGYNNILSLGFLQTGFANKTYNASPITGSSLVVDEVFGLHTNGNNFAKVWIQAVGSASVTIEFTTFGGTAAPIGPPVPTIANVVNNSSLIPAGLPNSGVAPSTLFVVQGANMAAAGSTPVLQDSTKGLPETLDQASLSVAAGGKTYTPAIYYSSPTQIAAVLPAAVPPGPATLTVLNGGTPSSAFNFDVVPSAFGIDAYNGNTAVLTDAASGALITPASSGKPGQIVILWGTGLGADSADSDTTYSSSPHAIDTPVSIYVGGVRATAVAYSGASVYPGVHVIGFTIPQGTPNGCYVPIIVVTGSGGNAVVSNTPVAAIMDNGGICSDPQYGTNGTGISGLNGQNTIDAGSIVVTHSTAPGTVGGALTITDIAIATFQQANGPSYGSTSLSLGTCTLNTQPGSNGDANAIALDAGTVTVTPPSSGAPISLPEGSTLPGLYSAYLPSGALDFGGTLTFQGSGGVKAPLIGQFTTTLNFPPPLNWINQSASATVTRASGLTYTWAGGAPGLFILMAGHSSSPSSGSSGGATATYTCIAPASAGQFTVPPYILLGLPAGVGGSSIANMTAQTPFSATGLDYAFTLGVFETIVGSAYQ
jgi:uncharacterized protein (TIGR03437 family)